MKFFSVLLPLALGSFTLIAASAIPQSESVDSQAEEFNATAAALAAIPHDVNFVGEVEAFPVADSIISFPPAQATVELFNATELEARKAAYELEKKSRNKLDKRAAYWFRHYVCTNSEFWGTCGEVSCYAFHGQCCNLSTTWRDTISSWRPDWDQMCSLHDRLDCGGNSLDWIRRPGFSDLNQYFTVWSGGRQILVNFNDNLKSFRCWKDGHEDW